jgi:hypothetical protein
MLWVELTDTATNEKLLVNLSLATSIVGLASGTLVRFDKENVVTVKETPRAVLAAAGVMVG